MTSSGKVRSHAQPCWRGNQRTRFGPSAPLPDKGRDPGKEGRAEGRVQNPGRSQTTLQSLAGLSRVPAGPSPLSGTQTLMHERQVWAQPESNPGNRPPGQNSNQNPESPGGVLHKAPATRSHQTCGEDEGQEGTLPTRRPSPPVEVAAEARGQTFSASDRVPRPPPRLLLNHKGKFSSTRGKTAP